VPGFLGVKQAGR